MSRRKVLTPPVTADITTASERQFLKYINGTRATIPLVGRLFGRLLVLRECVRPSHLFEGFAGAAMYDRHRKAKGAVLVAACTEPIGQEQARETL